MAGIVYLIPVSTKSYSGETGRIQIGVGLENTVRLYSSTNPNTNSSDTWSAYFLRRTDFNSSNAPWVFGAPVSDTSTVTQRWRFKTDGNSNTPLIIDGDRFTVPRDWGSSTSDYYYYIGINPGIDGSRKGATLEISCSDTSKLDPVVYTNFATGYYSSTNTNIFKKGPADDVLLGVGRPWVNLKYNDNNLTFPETIYYNPVKSTDAEVLPNNWRATITSDFRGCTYTIDNITYSTYESCKAASWANVNNPNVIYRSEDWLTIVPETLYPIPDPYETYLMTEHRGITLNEDGTYIYCGDTGNQGFLFSHWRDDLDNIYSIVDKNIKWDSIGQVKTLYPTLIHACNSSYKLEDSSYELEDNLKFYSLTSGNNIESKDSINIFHYKSIPNILPNNTLSSGLDYYFRRKLGLTERQKSEKILGKKYTENQVSSNSFELGNYSNLFFRYYEIQNDCWKTMGRINSNQNANNDIELKWAQDCYEYDYRRSQDWGKGICIEDGELILNVKPKDYYVKYGFDNKDGESKTFTFTTEISDSKGESKSDINLTYYTEGDLYLYSGTNLISKQKIEPGSQKDGKNIPSDENGIYYRILNNNSDTINCRNDNRLELKIDIDSNFNIERGYTHSSNTANGGIFLSLTKDSIDNGSNDKVYLNNSGLEAAIGYFGHKSWYKGSTDYPETKTKVISFEIPDECSCANFNIIPMFLKNRYYFKYDNTICYDVCPYYWDSTSNDSCKKLSESFKVGELPHNKELKGWMDSSGYMIFNPDFTYSEQVMTDAEGENPKYLKKIGSTYHFCPNGKDLPALSNSIQYKVIEIFPFVEAKHSKIDVYNGTNFKPVVKRLNLNTPEAFKTCCEYKDEKYIIKDDLDKDLVKVRFKNDIIDKESLENVSDDVSLDFNLSLKYFEAWPVFNNLNQIIEYPSFSTNDGIYFYRLIDENKRPSSTGSSIEILKFYQQKM